MGYQFSKKILELILMEVARMDEDTVLKTAGAYKAFVGSNPTASATLGFRLSY